MPRLMMTAAAMAAVLVSAPAFATPATTAADVCPGNPATCNVTGPFEVTNGATLDFGSSTLNISGAGSFDFSSGSGNIYCGPLNVSTTNPAIDASGPDPFGGTAGGKIVVKARRKCTGGTPNVPCLDLNDCQLGTCGVRRCTLKTTKTCLDDSNCQIGPCGATKRCSGSALLVRCNTNADCDFGSCPAQLTCANRAENPVDCTVNADCDFGTCTLGSASISLGGAIAANSDSPATIELRAADNVSISKVVNMSSSSAGGDGGDLTVKAYAGAVSLTANLNLTGGGDSQGGAVELDAGTDVTVGPTSQINVNGGDFDGGSVDITAGNDVTIGHSLLGNSIAGAGFGGEFTIDAGRDLAITAVSAANKTTIETSGHTDIENFAGDGGTQDLTSGRNLSMNVNTRMLGNGSTPDGYGSDFSMDVTGNVAVNGDIVAKALGAQGSGGYLEILGAGLATVGTTGNMDLTGGSGGGGVIDLESTGNLSFSGIADISGSNGGSGGSTFISSDADATVAGTLTVNGNKHGAQEVDACRITLTSTGTIDSTVLNGSNKLLVHESMKLLTGSTMTADASSTNTLVYRTPAKPPVVNGTVSPAPILVINDKLTGCPVCGNGEIDQGETCDDGNTVNGDNCSSTCQNEKCIAQTGAPGYPTVPLCDDGDLCTTDVCNTSLNGGTCQHPAKSCDDAIACTVDACVPGTGVCSNTPNNAACDDSNVCTDDVCSVGTGCAHASNTNACNDNNSCTENDVCSAGQCHGSSIPGCGVCGDGQVNDPEQCDDGNATFTPGEYCGVGCVLVACGDTNNSGTITTSDALFTLKAAVGQGTCSLRICDVDNSTKVLASDAQRLLRKAVGQAVTLNCPTS